VDIKTEEEKRQEVEAALVQLGSGTPLSNLIDHGLSEEIYEVLVAGGIGTVEKVASMTPEELELIAGVTSDSVAQLGMAVNSFYGQGPAEVAVEESVEPEAAAVETPAEGAAPTAPEPGPGLEAQSVWEAAVALPSDGTEASPELESDTIEKSGLPRTGSSEN